MTLAGLSLRDRTEYEQGSAFEAALRTAVEHVPAWLYDASDLGTVIDDLNRARSFYEHEHPDEPRIETAGPDAYNRAQDARITARIAAEYPSLRPFLDASESGGNR